MKELPYYRFTASEWLTDDISFESYDVKGVFIDACSFYWMRDCVVTKEVLEKRFSNAKELLEVCFSTEIIKLKQDDFIEITFLDNQYDLLSEKRQKRQKSGKKGGLAKSSNAKAKRKQTPSYKDKDKDKYNESITKIIDYLNLKADTKFKPKTQKTISLINARLSEGFTISDFKKAIDNKVSEWKGDDKWCQYLRPTTLFSIEKFEGYVNQKPAKKSPAEVGAAELDKQQEEMDSGRVAIEYGKPASSRFK